MLVKVRLVNEYFFVTVLLNTSKNIHSVGYRVVSHASFYLIKFNYIEVH